MITENGIDGPGTANRTAFDKYLQNVFGWCGSASLEMQLKPVTDFGSINSGDVLVKGGYPGHAMIVVDVAVNDKGKKGLYAGTELSAGTRHSHSGKSSE